MLRKGLILVVVSLTASLPAAQVQVPDQRSWGQLPIDPGGRKNIPTPLGDDSAVSATSLAAPKRARAAYEKAMKEIDKGPSANLDKARQYLEKAVKEYPEYTAAWTRGATSAPQAKQRSPSSSSSHSSLGAFSSI